MLLVLLSVILFSTIFLGTFNGIFINSEIVFEGAYRLQAQKIIDFIFQRVDAELLQAQNDGSSSTTFNTVLAAYSNYTATISLDGINYNLQAQASPCDQYGNTGSPSPDFRLLRTWVTFVINSTDTLFVGTSSNPMSKVYANNGMY